MQPGCEGTAAATGSAAWNSKGTQGQVQQQEQQQQQKQTADPPPSAKDDNKMAKAKAKAKTTADPYGMTTKGYRNQSKRLPQPKTAERHQ